ncbi:MAG: DinB family protein [Bacteroidota bacterium]
MTKAEIKTQLETKYKSFSDFIVSLNDQEFINAPNGKWTAGQQLDHLIRAVSPLATGLRLPKFLLKVIFGKSNRPSKSYEDLVKKYILKLEAGGRASGRFVPIEILPKGRQKNIDKLSKKVNQLEDNLNSYSEEQLDIFILPHPLLGKVTLREMMYFTIYHAEHHLKQTIKNTGK